ncbi:hypothetical protein ABBQ38_009677 [Trebouxia sp. C0009 RCD-2024]
MSVYARFPQSLLGYSWLLGATASFLIGTAGARDAVSAVTGPKRCFQNQWHNRTGSVSQEEQFALRDEARQMFFAGYESYLLHAFPKDELRPISCSGHDSQGGMAMTLIDALDSLLVMNSPTKLREATSWLQDNLTFDVDQRVHVFEVTIRVLGGLLSCHIMLERMPSTVPGYDGALLRLATDLGNRLLPAFDTKSGIPLSWVHLRKGVMPKESRFTCTACAGTMLLEFGTLSRLTGNPVYEQKARHAVNRVFGEPDY